MKTPKYLARRAIASQAEAAQTLTNYLPSLETDFRESWDWAQAIMEQDPNRRRILNASTQAAMVHDCFVTRMRTRYSDDPRVTLKATGRMLRMRIDGMLSLRFKKFDSKLRSRNVKTNSQVAIYFQMEMEGIDGATDVTFGYKTDATGRKWVGMYVTCPVGWGQNKWVIVLNEEGGESGMFSFSPTTDSPDNSPIIEPKDKRKIAE